MPLVLKETQNSLNQVWTQVTDSIPNDDNRYARGAKWIMSIWFSKLSFFSQKREKDSSTETQSDIYLPSPPLGQDMTQGQFLSRV